LKTRRRQEKPTIYFTNHLEEHPDHDVIEKTVREPQKENEPIIIKRRKCLDSSVVNKELSTPEETSEISLQSAEKQKDLPLSIIAEAPHSGSKRRIIM